MCNPAAAMAKYGSNPKMKDFMAEFMKLMGEHFTQLGEMQDAAAAEQTTNATKQQKQPIVSQEEARLQREADQMLQNPEIMQILSDPETKKVSRNLRIYFMHACLIY